MRTKQRYSRKPQMFLRETQGRGWVLTGNTVDEWIEIRTFPRGRGRGDLTLRYVRKTEYEDTTRYTSSFPAYPVERLIRDGVVVG